MATKQIQDAKENQVKLLEVIRDICGRMNKLPFGHGARAYANTPSMSGIYKREVVFPRAYLYPMLIQSDVNAQGKIDNSYSCSMDFLTICKLSDDQELLEARLYDMFILSETFLYHLANHGAVKPKSLTNIERTPNYHVYDHNLCGYGLTFDLKLIEDYRIC